MGAARRIKKKYPNHRVQSYKNDVLMPGMVNVHTHLEIPPLLDTVRARTFPEWIINLIRAKKSLSVQDYKRTAKRNIENLIQYGTTTVGEICTHGVSPATLNEAGLRAVVYQEIISMDPHRPFIPSSADCSRPLSRITSGFSPHSPYTISEAVLRGICNISREKGIRLAMHIAESRDETRLLQGKRTGLHELYHLAEWDLSWAPKGLSSIEYLGRIGMLTCHLLAVHVVQVTEKDIRLIKKSKVPIGHCPRSNKETGVGKMPLEKFLNAGITVGLGTDSLASSPSLNLWDELRYAFKIHRRNGITAEDLFRLATIGGAKALGLEKEIGTLEVGKKADIIVVPMPANNTGDIYFDLLRETKSCIMMMVNGKILNKV